MKEIELIGGPLDGAFAEDFGGFCEGDHFVLEPRDVACTIYTFHDGCLEYNAALSREESRL